MNKTDILLLEKIYYLSKRLENKKFYDLLDPWQFKSSDSIEVQKAGKRISSFIGLQNLTFVITYTKQNEGTAGHIELNNKDEVVFIEIESEFKDDCSVVLAILAHEICHKLINIYGLTLFGYENEILTDIATVYTGLGKLSLNGCETVSSSTQTNFKNDNNLNTLTTTTYKVGYLSKSQFAFIYNVICKMRRVPDEYKFNSLNQAAIISVKANQLNIIEDLFYNEFVVSKVKNDINLTHKNIQLLLAENIKASKILNQLLFKIEESNNNYHTKLKSTVDEFLDRAKLSHKLESLNFIKNLILISEIDNIFDKFRKEEEEITVLNKIIIPMIMELFANNQNVLDLIEKKALYTIECPVCNLKMNLNQEKLVRVTCSRCKYSFLVDNKNIDIKFNENNKDSITTKIKKIFSIIKE